MLFCIECFANGESFRDLTFSFLSNSLKNKETAKSESSKKSISPTFYEQLFCTKVFVATFLSLHFLSAILSLKEIAACKMLLKLTKGLSIQPFEVHGTPTCRKMIILGSLSCKTLIKETQFNVWWHLLMAPRL